MSVLARAVLAHQPGGFRSSLDSIFQLSSRTPHNGFAELVRSFHTRVVVALRHGTCTAQLERSFRFVRRFAKRLTNAKSMCRASIAARNILTSLLYRNTGLEIIFLGGTR